MKLESFEEVSAIVKERGITGAWWESAGEVKGKVSPCGRLLKLSYTGRAMTRGKWTWFERNSRGHIYNILTGELIARPFEKFFNWGEGGRTTDAIVESVTEKLDGSLGIIHLGLDGELCVTTRGAFESPQALWATEFLHGGKSGADFIFCNLKQYTWLVEIIYPENRIVVDYGAECSLKLIGIVSVSTGRVSSPKLVAQMGEKAGIGSAPLFYCAGLGRYPAGKEPWSAEKLQAHADKLLNSEGYVVRFADGSMFKIKGERYLARHRAKFGLTEQRVIEAYFAGASSGLLGLLDDECKAQARVWINETVLRWASLRKRADASAHNIFAGLPEHFDRKRLALIIQMQEEWCKPYLFAVLSKKPRVEQMRRLIASCFGKKAAKIYKGDV